MKDIEKPIFAAVISNSSEDIENQDWKINTINKGVPMEAVIMQLKSLIKNFENNYFEEFNNKLTK